jgi:hypothetical protein
LFVVAQATRKEANWLPHPLHSTYWVRSGLIVARIQHQRCIDEMKLPSCATRSRSLLKNVTTAPRSEILSIANRHTFPDGSAPERCVFFNRYVSVSAGLREHLRFSSNHDRCADSRTLAVRGEVGGWRIQLPHGAKPYLPKTTTMDSVCGCPAICMEHRAGNRAKRSTMAHSERTREPDSLADAFRPFPTLLRERPIWGTESSRSPTGLEFHHSIPTAGCRADLLIIHTAKGQPR